MPPAQASRGWILSALMITMMLAAMDTTIVSTVIPQIVDDLGGFALFAWVFSIYMLAQTVVIPIYGKLADQYGRKPVLLGGTLLFLIGSAACASAWDMPSLIIFRAIQGLGAGSIMATVNTLAGDLFEVRERARVQGWLSSVWGLSAIAGPTLGGILVEYVSWRWIFLVNLPVGAVALVMIGVFLHENVEKRSHQIDYLGSLLILLTVGTLVFGLLQTGNSWPLRSGYTLAWGIAVFVLAVATVQIEKRAAEPVLPGWLWRRRVLLGSNLGMVAMGILMMGPIAYLPTFVQSTHGVGTMVAGLVLATMSIGWPLASSLSGKLYLKIGFRNTALAGALLAGGACLAFLGLPQQIAIGWIALDQFFFGAGLGLISTSLLVGVQSTVGWSQRGVVTGANMFSRNLGQTLGAAIFGAIFNAVLAKQLVDAPQALAAELPREVNQIMETLHSAAIPHDALRYVQHAIYGATDAIYVGVLMFAVLAFVFIAITPKHFAANE
ncbi:Putative transporter [gamma proteobacterium HdN1]|nr:Putative transporter [gamma proteobacterium HdN1]